jgi:hypothetical protein
MLILKKGTEHFIYKSIKEDKRYAGSFSQKDSVLYLDVHTINRGIITLPVQFKAKGFTLGDRDLELNGLQYVLKGK